MGHSMESSLPFAMGDRMVRAKSMERKEMSSRKALPDMGYSIFYTRPPCNRGAWRNPVQSDIIPWHPAFFEAIQLELEAYKDVLEFKYEYQLTTEPLRIDTLIVKKPENVTIDKNFARLFKAENLIEFKSPDDYLSVKDFYKLYAYACLYAAITPEVDVSAITLTFIETKYPRELVKHLQEIRNYIIEETWPGIYHVSGDFFPIQILESKKLSPSDNIWLKSLNNGLDFSGLGVILKESRLKAKDIPIRAYLNAIIQANAQIIKEIEKMSDGAQTLDDVLEEMGWTTRWEQIGEAKGEARGEAKGKHIVAQNLLKKGWSVEETAATAELEFDTVKSLYAAMKQAGF
ncbi:hypothetical protein FACS189479_00890 [Spirochaetia bacterium]|nr:hypothetical protein FACS189479_00890 [Spirochaetia bacterium]